MNTCFLQCETKCAADQRLCFRYIDSTIPYDAAHSSFIISTYLVWICVVMSNLPHNSALSFASLTDLSVISMAYEAKEALTIRILTSVV